MRRMIVSNGKCRWCEPPLGVQLERREHASALTTALMLTAGVTYIPDRFL
jgi:hypothetical protein